MGTGVALKICGVRRVEDLRVCTELGVDAIGLNLWPGSRRYLDLAAATPLLETWPSPGPTRVAVIVERSAAELDADPLLEAFDAIQPHGDAPVEPYALLAERRGLDWVWVVRGTPKLDSLRVPAPAPAWILLDAAVAGYGGAGKTTDWAWAAEAVEALAPIPVWLAGGLRPDNVAAAIAEVRPAGIDVASGAEQAGATSGEKDPEAIAALVRACRAGRGP